MSQNESPTAGTEAPGKATFIAKNNRRNSCPAFGWPRCAQILPRLHHTRGSSCALCIIGGILTCGLACIPSGIIALIEGIMYLTKSDDEFYQLYAVEKKGLF